MSVQSSQTLTSHASYLPAWEQAMRFGLMGGRPYSPISVWVYLHYAQWFLKNHGNLSVDTLKKALLDIPVKHFAKRQKLFQSLTSLARFLVQENAIDPTYLTDSKPYKPRRHLPPVKHTVDGPGIEKLLTAAGACPLDRLLMILLSRTGLRVSKAANLEIQDINLERRELRIKLAKWGKNRRVGFSPMVLIALQDYLAARPHVEFNRLLVNTKNQPMDRFGIRVRLDKLGEKAGIKVTPHALRRAFVTLNANAGRPLVMLQIACGHNDIATTRSYCMTTEDETVEAMRDWE